MATGLIIALKNHLFEAFSKSFLFATLLQPEALGHATPNLCSAESQIFPPPLTLWMILSTTKSKQCNDKKMNETKGLASQCKAQEKYKERLDSGVTWLKWLPTGMESKTRLAPKSNKVNSHKLTLNWNTSLYYRVVWKWCQSAFHANNHAIGGGSNGIIIHLCLNPGFGLQLLSINFVGFGSQHGLRFHTSRQSFEPSYTQIQALLVFFLSFALASQPGEICWLPTKRVGGGTQGRSLRILWQCLERQKRAF